VAVGLGVSVGVALDVAVGVIVGVAVGLGVSVGVAVGVAVEVAVGVGVSVGVPVGVGVGATTVSVVEPVGASSWLSPVTLLDPFVYPPTAPTVTSTLRLHAGCVELRVPLVTEMPALAGLAVIAPVPLGQVVATLFGLATVIPDGSVSVNDQVLAASSLVLVIVKVSVAVPPWRTVVGLKAFVSCGVESVTITSSITGPHGPGVVLLKVSVVADIPAVGESSVPRDWGVHPILAVLWPVTSNEKLLLNDPNDTVSVLTTGEVLKGKPHAIASGVALPARANVTEYTCPKSVWMFWDTELGLSVLRSLDWIPLLGFHPLLALLLSISAPFGPAIQGPAVALGNGILALTVVKRFPGPTVGCSKPQSPTRFVGVAIEQSGCGVGTGVPVA
jgi:hypothetical protein